MKLECVLTATDLNPLYYQLVPTFVEAWRRTHPDVDVRIVLVGDEVPELLKPYEDKLILFKPLRGGVPTALTAQCIRLLYPGILDYRNGVMITDVDRIPLNSTYYTGELAGLSDDKFASTHGGHLLHVKQISIVYNAGTSNTWRDMFGVSSEEEARQRLRRIHGRATAKWKRIWQRSRHAARFLLDNTRGIRTFEDIRDARLRYTKSVRANADYHLWFLDQKELYRSAMRWHRRTGNLVLPPGYPEHYRNLSRDVPLNLEEEKDKITSGYYSSYNVHRPYSEHKQTIDAVVELL